MFADSLCSKVVQVISVVVTVSLLGFSSPAASQGGKFVPRYGSARTPALQKIIDDARDTRMMEKFAVYLSAVAIVPSNVALVLNECGIINAYYEPGKRALIICAELLQQIFRTVPLHYRRITGPGEIEKITVGVLFFILLHELGHALIHLHQIPVLGREEDAADQISMAILLKERDAHYAVAGASWFFSKNSLFYTKKHMADEHSLDPQRRYNVYCWAVGSNPKKFAYLVQSGELPQNRSVRCSAEFAQLNRAVKKLVGPHLKGKF